MGLDSTRLTIWREPDVEFLGGVNFHREQVPTAGMALAARVLWRLADDWNGNAEGRGQPCEGKPGEILPYNWPVVVVQF